MDENKIIIVCPNCSQKLGLPQTSSRLLVTCPTCKNEFYYPFEKRKKRKFWWKKTDGTFRWYQKNWFVVLMLLFFPVIGIILIWNNPRYRSSLKIGVTIAVALYIFWGFANKRYITPIPPETYRIGNKESLPIYLPKSYIPLGIIWDFEGPNMQEKSIPEIFQKAKNSIVIIKTRGKSGELISEGTGFIISKGIIVTNYHVLAGVYGCEVKLTDGTVFPKVSLIKADMDKDIAVIKIPAENFPNLPLGDSEKLEVGQEIITIGNPLGLEMSISTGIVSAFRENKSGVEYIQITAPVSPGSSGGPLLNKKGAVVGIVTLQVPSMFGQNLNFAIPIKYLYEVLP